MIVKYSKDQGGIATSEGFIEHHEGLETRLVRVRAHFSEVRNKGALLRAKDIWLSVISTQAKVTFSLSIR